MPAVRVFQGASGEAGSGSGSAPGAQGCRQRCGCPRGGLSSGGRKVRGEERFVLRMPLCMSGLDL